MKKLVIILLTALCLSACKKDEIDPRQQILGKWEIFYLGNGEYRPPIDNPFAYREFLPDSLYLEYEYATKRTITYKYWIDSLLHIGAWKDGVWFTSDYKVDFDRDTMVLERKNIYAIFYISKHKRIN